MSRTKLLPEEQIQVEIAGTQMLVQKLVLEELMKISDILSQSQPKLSYSDDVGQRISEAMKRNKAK